MMSLTPVVSVTVMSGREDGRIFHLHLENGDSLASGIVSTIHIGRSEDNEICLLYDTFVSRYHAYIHWKDERWWLEDNNSTNGTSVETTNQREETIKGKGPVEIQPGQLFRIGRTWLCLELEDE
jgi:pSer/pThr/pTyr-binding forkhead associated (FHA) protein